MKQLLSMILGIAMLSGIATAQQTTSIRLDGSFNGMTLSVPCSGMNIYDDGGAGSNYERGHDCRVILEADCSEAAEGQVLCITLSELDIAQSDTLYIYDGVNQQAPLLVKCSQDFITTTRTVIPISLSNSIHKIMIRFRSAQGSTPTAEGFHLVADYRFPCDDIEVQFDPQYQRIADTGSPIEPELSLVDFLYHTDTLLTGAAVRCAGSTLRLWGSTTHTNLTEYSTTEVPDTLVWAYPIDGRDTVSKSTTDSSALIDLSPARISYITLYATDIHGCQSRNSVTLPIVTFDNPIASIADTLPLLYGYDSLLLQAGFSDTYQLVLSEPTTGINLQDYSIMTLFPPTDTLADYSFVALVKTVRWVPDTNYETDFPGGGLYHGIEVGQRGSFDALVQATNLTQVYRIHADVTDVLGCPWRAETTLWTIADATLSIKDIVDSQSQITLYPNPARDHLTVALTQVAVGTEIVVTDITGRTLLRQTANNPTTLIALPSDRFPRGTYFVKIGPTAAKFVIQ